MVMDVLRNELNCRCHEHGKLADLPRLGRDLNVANSHPS